jgi:hypothetical protein
LLKDCWRGLISKCDNVVDINASSRAQLKIPKTINWCIVHLRKIVPSGETSYWWWK